MGYVLSRLLEYEKEMMFRVYITDGIHYTPQGKSLSKRYIEQIKFNKRESAITGDEIAADVITRLGLSIGGTTNESIGFNGCP